MGVSKLVDDGFLEGQVLRESFHSEGGTKVGSSNLLSGGKVSEKLEGSPLGYSLGSDGGYEMGY